jgi:hypothetical protein
MIIVVLALTMLVTLLVWTNSSSVDRRKQPKLLLKTFSLSFISIAAVVYFMDLGNEDEVIQHMIKTAPDF